MSNSIFGVVIFSLMFCSCKDHQNNGYANIPNLPVNVTIFTNDPQFLQLSVVGGWAYVAGGSRGILVYRYINDEFVALERHCPYQSELACAKVEIDSSNFVQAHCKCCNSKFMLFDGSVANGPATLPLIRYRTQFSGNVLQIIN